MNNMNILKNFLAALQFLTNITVSKRLGMDEKILAESTPCFPLIGILIGFFLAGVYIIFSGIFPEIIPNF